MKAARGKRTLLLVDGYNVLNAWKGAALIGDMADARDSLVERLRDYAGATGLEVTVVFDAWMTDRMTRTLEDAAPISVVFTQRGETADHFIERRLDELSKSVAAGRIEVRVATSDLVEQTVGLGRGAIRVSARELIADFEQNRARVRQISKTRAGNKNTIMDALPVDVAAKLERMRRGEN